MGRKARHFVLLFAAQDAALRSSACGALSRRSPAPFPYWASASLHARLQKGPIKVPRRYLFCEQRLWPSERAWKQYL